MKTIAQEKFDSIIKEGFHVVLSPLGFRKKASNFYLFKNGIGQIINVQKSRYSTKAEIEFTINTGIFLPEFWSVFHNYFGKPVPDFPTEPECLLRYRIGHLKNQSDLWYKVTSSSNTSELINEMRKNVMEYICPHFAQISSKETVISFIDRNYTQHPNVQHLVVFAELGENEKAKSEYQRLVLTSTRNPAFLATLKEYSKKYGLG